MTKSTTDTSKVSNQGRGQQLISDVKPNQRKYGRRTVKETPKEENINYRHNNAYIKSSIKEEKNDKNDNEGSKVLSQSFVVGRRNNEPEEKVSKKEVIDINAQNIPLPPRQLNNNITNNINNINNNFENNRIIIGEDKKSNFRPASLNIHSNIINKNKDNPSDINRIKSIFLLRQIFSYIEDKDFPYILFFYSKLFKNKFGISLDYYKNLYQHFEKKKFEDPYIDSPLFNEIISDDTIYLSQHYIKKFDYNKLNNAKEKYSSFFYLFKNDKCLDDLKLMKIDYNNLKTMVFTERYHYMDKNKLGNYTYFFKSLFSLNIKNNLIFLKISFEVEKNNAVESSTFELVNNLKTLRYLHIERINFNKNPNLELSNLKELYCYKCINLCLSKINCKKLKSLYYFGIKELNLDGLISDNFKELKILELHDNNISNIDALEKAQFENINILELEHNNLTDINILKNVNFKKLRILSLDRNKISDIEVLEQVKFENLEEIHLGENKISDINVLKNVNFKKLKILSLFSNEITDIKVLAEVNFKKLEVLYLNYNNISNIDILQNTNFEQLTVLGLSGNKISNINVLEKVKYEKLKILELEFNQIRDISALKSGNFKELEELDLSFNKLNDTESYLKNFKKMKKLKIDGQNLI